MQIVFYNNSSEKNKLDKSLTIKLTLDGTLKDRTSIIDPVITVELTSFPSNINYMYIPNFSNRYYFINEIISVGNNLWEIHAHVDVLYTYRSRIRGLDAFIDRYEWGHNPVDSPFIVNKIPDTMQLLGGKPEYTFIAGTKNIYDFPRPTSETDHTIVLTTIKVD